MAHLAGTGGDRFYLFVYILGYVCTATERVFPSVDGQTRTSSAQGNALNVAVAAAWASHPSTIPPDLQGG